MVRISTLQVTSFALLSLLLFTLLVPVPWAPAVGPVAAQSTADDFRAGRPLGPADGVWLAEVVTDPQHDGDGSGSVTTSDESVVVYNAGTQAVDLTGWVLHMDDSTPEAQGLEGSLAAGARLMVANPTGQMNNDVRLRLVDGAGVEVDNVTLGLDGVPDGNADDVRDEAVALVGPWAAVQTPAVGTEALGVVWVEALARTGTDGPGAFAPLWLTSGTTQVDVRVHVAPEATVAPTTLSWDDVEVPLNGTEDAGFWRTEAFTIPSSDVAVTVGYDDNGTAQTIAAFPARAALTLRVDATPATFPRDAPVANATGHLRWLPAPTDAESGVAALEVFQEVNGSYVVLDGCVPTSDPAATCRLVDPDQPDQSANASTAADALVRINATNGAGETVAHDVAVVVDEEAPLPPQTLDFATGIPPRFTWAANEEALKRLQIEVAEDVTGVYTIAVGARPGNTTAYTDDTYVPGDARAYRVVVTDRADLVGTGPWVSLPPSAVPVAVTLPDLGAATETLVDVGQVELNVGFDRTMAQAPTLAFGANGTDPFHVEADGTLAPDAKAARYVVEVPAGFPWSGRGVWSVAGGAATDDAVVAPVEVDVAWDREAPVVTVKDAPGHWIRDTRHVVTFEAWDAVDDDPRVVVTGKPDDAGVWGKRAARKVTLRSEGLHELVGHAEDAKGNTRDFRVTVGLDATPPVLAEVTRPSVWNATAPLRIDVQDATSGVVRDATRLWVRNATEVVQVQPSSWRDTVASFVPPQTLVGPFELHVAAADAAGNLAEGPLGPALSGAGARVAPDEGSVLVAGPNGTTPTQPTGPAWGTDAPLSSGDGSGSGSSSEGGAGSSLWDPAKWRAAGQRTASKDPAEDGLSGGWWWAAGIGSIGLGTAAQRAWARKHERKEPAKKRQKEKEEGGRGAAQSPPYPVSEASTKL